MEQKNQITEGVIWKQLLIFFFPIVIGTFFQQIYNTADSIVVGRFVGKEALAAVGGSVNQIVMLIVEVFVGLTSGASVIMAQFYGARDRKNLNKTLHTAYAFAIVTGAVVGIMGFMISPNVLVMMKTPSELMTDSITYLHIYFCGMIFNIIYNMGASILRAVGDSKRPLYVLIMTCVLNIALDILLVVIFHMGVMGVALATVTCQGTVKLADGDILRVGRTTDSVFSTMLSSSLLLGGLLIVILAVAFVLVRKQTRDLIKPINTLDLEEPLKEVKYEELRPLLKRVDQQNRQIARQIEELKEAEAVRKEFSANVSHELKTPLMSISGYAELMMNGMVPPEKVPEFSGRIYHEAYRLSALVADIIQLSRLDEKNSDLPFEEVDLYEMAEDVVQHLESAAKKKNITVSLDGSLVMVNGVRHVIYEMLFNIADNAIRYTDPKGTVKISLGMRGEHPYYCVEDNGIGIAEDEQKRIFERFYRVDKSHSRATGGTGLGLSIVKHGAILHNAQIKLESEPGKGTKMELMF